MHDLRALEPALRSQARVIGTTRRELRELRELVDAMTEADRIAAAVTTALKRDRRAWWSVSRVIAGVIAGAILLVPAVHDLVTWVAGGG